MKVKFQALVVLMFTTYFSSLMAQYIPDEYESSAGIGQALNNSSAAYGVGDLSALKTNPALLFSPANYTFSAGYHWPTSGREFYQAGIVDTQTGSLATGLSYTGYLDEYKIPTVSEIYDSRVHQRLRGAIATSVDNVIIGASIQYLEAKTLGSLNNLKNTTGVHFGFGIFSPITKSLKFGLSAENFGSDKTKDFAPKTYLAGISYQMSTEWTLNLDFKQRERVLEEYMYQDPERMGFAALIYQPQKNMQFFASYGSEFSTEQGFEKRESLSGGASVQLNQIKLSYILSKPYQALQENHQSIGLSFAIHM